MILVGFGITILASISFAYVSYYHINFKKIQGLSRKIVITEIVCFGLMNLFFIIEIICWYSEDDDGKREKSFLITMQFIQVVYNLQIISFFMFAFKMRKSEIQIYSNELTVDQILNKINNYQKCANILACLQIIIALYGLFYLLFEIIKGEDFKLDVNKLKYKKYLLYSLEALELLFNIFLVFLNAYFWRMAFRYIDLL